MDVSQNIIDTQKDKWFIDKYGIQAWAQTPENVRDEYRLTLKYAPEKLGADAVEKSKSMVSTPTMVGKAVERGFFGGLEGIANAEKYVSDFEKKHNMSSGDTGTLSDIQKNLLDVAQSNKQQATQERFMPYAPKDDSTSELVKYGAKNLLLGIPEMVSDPVAMGAMVATEGLVNPVTSKIAGAGFKGAGLVAGALKGGAGFVGYDAAKNLLENQDNNLLESFAIGAIASPVTRLVGSAAKRIAGLTKDSTRVNTAATNSALEAIEKGKQEHQQEIDAAKENTIREQALLDNKSVFDNAKSIEELSNEVSQPELKQIGYTQKVEEPTNEVNPEVNNEEQKQIGYTPLKQPLMEYTKGQYANPDEVNFVLNKMKDESPEKIQSVLANEGFYKDIHEINQMLKEENAHADRVKILEDKGYPTDSLEFKQILSNKNINVSELPPFREALDLKKADVFNKNYTNELEKERLNEALSKQPEATPLQEAQGKVAEHTQGTTQSDVTRIAKESKLPELKEPNLRISKEEFDKQPINQQLREVRALADEMQRIKDAMLKDNAKATKESISKEIDNYYKEHPAYKEAKRIFNKGEESFKTLNKPEEKVVEKKYSDKDMQRLHELSQNPEFKSVLESMKADGNKSVKAIEASFKTGKINEATKKELTNIENEINKRTEEKISSNASEYEAIKNSVEENKTGEEVTRAKLAMNKIKNADPKTAEGQLAIKEANDILMDVDKYKDAGARFLQEQLSISKEQANKLKSSIDVSSDDVLNCKG